MVLKSELREILMKSSKKLVCNLYNFAGKPQERKTTIQIGPLLTL